MFLSDWDFIALVAVAIVCVVVCFGSFLVKSRVKPSQQRQQTMIYAHAFVNNTKIAHVSIVIWPYKNWHNASTEIRIEEIYDHLISGQNPFHLVGHLKSEIADLTAEDCDQKARYILSELLSHGLCNKTAATQIYQWILKCLRIYCSRHMQTA